MIEKKNGEKPLPFRLQIAHGFEICKEITEPKLKEAIATADQRMYENKAALKAVD